MPELSCDLRIGPAISEPVQLADGRVLIACETPARDAIHVGELLLSESGALFTPIATLPGGPTDNGTRAMWPRLSDAGAVAYQRGTQNVIHGLDGTWQSRGDGSPGRSYGIWPVAPAGRNVTGLYFEAPASTSQGVFGYFGFRWWTNDETRESRYQRDWAHLGTLSHAWNDTSDNFLYKHQSGTILRRQFADGNRTERVFSGHAEYPRGCTLADGRILVCAVSESGYLRVAVSPFEPFEIEEPMPTPSLSVESVLQTRSGVSCVVRYENMPANFITKRVRLLGWSTWISEPVTIPSTNGRLLTAFDARDPGVYEYQFEHGAVETSIRQFVIVADPPPPAPTPVTVTASDLAGVGVAIAGITRKLTKAYEAVVAGKCEWAAHYATARIAGQSHEDARQSVVLAAEKVALDIIGEGRQS